MPVIEPKSPTVRRWRWWLLVPAALGLAGTALLIQGTGWRHRATLAEAEQRLAAAEAEAERLDGPWRLADLASRHPPPDGDAEAFRAITARMPPKWPAWGGPSQVVTAVLPGAEKPARAFDRDTLRNLLPPVLLTPVQADELRAELGRAAEALAMARQFADRPPGRLPFAPAKDPLHALKQPPDIGGATGLLSYDSRLLAQDGDAEGALRSCRAHLNAAAAIGDLPIPGYQSARDRIRFAVTRELEHVLALTEPSPEALAAFQAQLAEVAAQPLALYAARGHRAAIDHFCQQMLRGEVPVAGWLGEDGERGPGAPDEQRLAITQARALLLERMNQLVEIFKLPIDHQGEALREWASRREDNPPLMKWLLATVGPWCLEPPRNPARLRCAVAALATERYRRQHGRWPEQLSDLVPAYLPAVPTDPFGMAPVHYARHEDRVTIYSVGTDLEDGGGVLRRQGVLKDPDDVGFELWAPDKRRQHPGAP